jgi:hypothetical protein
MLGRHRKFFDKEVCRITGGSDVEWLDFPCGDCRREEGHIRWDREWHHLQFLHADDPARIAWDAAWPTHRTGPNWDAIGKLHLGSATEWLLVEAKANVEELLSQCRATGDSLKRINQTLSETKLALSATGNPDWTQPHYQYCNRLAALYVMNRNGSAARLLQIYFCGDKNEHRDCPTSKAAWAMELEKRDTRLGLPASHRLSDRIHDLFIHVECTDL